MGGVDGTFGEYGAVGRRKLVQDLGGSRMRKDPWSSGQELTIKSDGHGRDSRHVVRARGTEQEHEGVQSARPRRLLGGAHTRAKPRHGHFTPSRTHRKKLNGLGQSKN